MNKYKNMVKFASECFECILKSPSKLFKSMPNITENEKNEIYLRIFEKFCILSESVGDNELPPSAISSPQIVYASFCEILGNEHPLREVNQRTNDFCMKFVDNVKSKIYNSDNPLHVALLSSAIGNVFDFSALTESESGAKFQFLIDGLDTKWFDRCDGFDEFLYQLENGNTFLLCGDNNGEIVFDKILLEFLREEYGWKNKEIYYGVKGKPALNDVLEEDAIYVGMAEVVDKIIPVSTNGYQGIFLDDGTEDFLEIFENADIVLCKGMGNFETLAYERSRTNLWFTMMIKCIVHENILNLPFGSLVFTKPM